MRRSEHRRVQSREPVVSSGFRSWKVGLQTSRSHRYPGRSLEKELDTSTHQEQGQGIGEGVYVISVASRLLNMHPQTLRKYERVGLVIPSRSLGMLRLYSTEDMVRLRLIKYMVEDLRMNLAGVEFALHFLSNVMSLRERIRAIAQASTLHKLMIQEIEDMLEELGARFPDNPQGV